MVVSSVNYAVIHTSREPYREMNKITFFSSLCEAKNYITNEQRTAEKDGFEILDVFSSQTKLEKDRGDRMYYTCLGREQNNPKKRNRIFLSKEREPAETKAMNVTKRNNPFKYSIFGTVQSSGGNLNIISGYDMEGEVDMYI